MRGKRNLAHFMPGHAAPVSDANTGEREKKRRERGERDMAETKENWKQASFWITPGLIIGLATLIIALANLFYTTLDGVRDDLSAQIRQTEARLDNKIDSKIDSLKEDVVRNTNKIDRLETKVDHLETKVDHISGQMSILVRHLMGPADKDG